MVIPKVQQIIWSPEHYDAHYGNAITMLIWLPCSHSTKCMAKNVDQKQLVLICSSHFQKRKIPALSLLGFDFYFPLKTQITFSHIIKKSLTKYSTNVQLWETEGYQEVTKILTVVCFFALFYKLCHCLFASVDLHCFQHPSASCGCWERMRVRGEVVA